MVRRRKHKLKCGCVRESDDIGVLTVEFCGGDHCAAKKKASKPVTPAERKRIERQRKRDRGLVPVEVWIRPENIDKLKRTERLLRTKPKVE